MRRLQHSLALFILVSLVAVFCHQLAFSDLILARGDTYNYFYPYWDARNAALRAGELPLWTSDIFMGAPLLANPQLGTFYPPNWLMLPFSAPDGVRWSALLHLVWAAWGVAVLYRATINENWQAALLAGAVFALGGYAGAHLEQINQLQGLSWLPWLLYLFHKVLTGERWLLWAMSLAAALALQFFSGHTQTVFMSGVALGLMALLTPDDVRAKGRGLFVLIAVAGLALLLAMPQLLPTLELTGMSNRGGGLNAQEATAFSLPPTYIGRALLPGYDGLLFTEFIGYVGVLGLGLALVGALQPLQAQRRQRWLWVALALVGLSFALGRFNPLYWLLADLPGFNLFRVPARWLLLWSLGAALLSGMGWQALVGHSIHRWAVAAVIFVIGNLMLIARLFSVDATLMTGPSVAANITLVLWFLGLGIFVFMWWVLPKLSRSLKTFGGIALFAILVLELFAAARILPYNDLAPRSVYKDQRFTISQMLAYGTEQVVAGRILSMSDLRFDPGDRRRLRERYEAMGMSEDAIQIAFTAVKSQEVIAPNLPLTWGIPSVDGYGGGVLPTIYYAQFTSLLLPEGSLRTTDGRLGELLALPACRGACVPEARWLRSTDTRYLITDKIYDVVHEGIRYDTTFAQAVEDELLLYRLNSDDPFAHTAIHILYTGSAAPLLRLRGAESGVVFDLNAASTLPLSDEIMLAEYDIDIDTSYTEAFIVAEAPGSAVLAATLVDGRTGSFVEMPFAPFERLLSSDVRIYTYDATQRAYLVPDLDEGAIFPDSWAGHEDALAFLEASPENVLALNSDVPAATLTLDGGLDDAASSVEITAYTPTRVVIEVEAATESYLYLTDAHYAGWQATVDGDPTPIHRANVLFRAVRVPAGDSTVVFEFMPTLWYAAAIVGSLIWIIVGLIALMLYRRGRQ